MQYADILEPGPGDIGQTLNDLGMAAPPPAKAHGLVIRTPKVPPFALPGAERSEEFWTFTIATNRSSPAWVVREAITRLGDIGARFATTA